MNRWQYLTIPCQNGIAITPDGQSFPMKQALNMVGTDGWDLIAVIPIASGSFEFIFKRPS